MGMNVIIGFALILIAFISGLLVRFVWSSPNSDLAILRTIILWLIEAALALAFMRMKSRLRIYSGLIILAGLFLPQPILVAHPSFYWPQAFQNILEPLLFFLPSLALVMAALLLQSGINHYQAWHEAGTFVTESSQGSRKRAGWAAVVCLVLSLLLLTKTLESLYWLTLWDHANDSLGYLWLAAPTLAVLFSGLMLSITLADKAKLAGLLYPLFVTALLFMVSVRAQSIDFRALTEAHAGQVSQAVEAYYAQTGRYPQDLS